MNIFQTKFIFLTKEECENKIIKINKKCSRSQFETLNNKENNRGSNIKYLPYVFTNEGIFKFKNIVKSKELKEKLDIVLDTFYEEKNSLIIENTPYLKEENIKKMIYSIRGKRVILDEDIAKLFQYETKMLNRQVLRNIERFPENYCFQLTEEECNTNLRCQNGTSSYGGRRYLPNAFTEYGVIMLTSVLKKNCHRGKY